MDGKVHAVARGQAQYTTFSGWDIYRDEVPLLAAVAPAQTSAMAQSLVNDAQQGGWLPKWPVANGYTGMMGGDSSDAIIAEAYAFGARDFDTMAALAAMVKGATQVQTQRRDLGQGYYTERPGLASYLANGYAVNDSATSGSAVPDGASLTLEYATDDSRSPRSRRISATPAHPARSSAGRRTGPTLYNTDSGFLQPRDAAGNFPAGRPGDRRAGQLRPVRLPGGQRRTVRLDGPAGPWRADQRHGRQRRRRRAAGHVLHPGQHRAERRRTTGLATRVDLLAPWVYDYAGEPYKTQAEVAQAARQRVLRHPRRRAGQRRPRRDELLVRLGCARHVPGDTGRPGAWCSARRCSPRSRSTCRGIT